MAQELKPPPELVATDDGEPDFRQLCDDWNEFSEWYDRTIADAEDELGGRDIGYMAWMELKRRLTQHAVVKAAPDATPIPMLLFCPKCGAQHVDMPDPENGWANPPHKSHLCHQCKTVWRPADVETAGVACLETRGSKDTWWAILRHAVPVITPPSAQHEKGVVVPGKLADELQAEIQNSIKELGPCDHSVNVCVCPLIHMADQLQAALAAAKETKQ